MKVKTTSNLEPNIHYINFFVPLIYNFSVLPFLHSTCINRSHNICTVIFQNVPTKQHYISNKKKGPIMPYLNSTN